jgi:hypothetical protein
LTIVTFRSPQHLSVSVVRATTCRIGPDAMDADLVAPVKTAVWLSGRCAGCGKTVNNPVGKLSVILWISCGQAVDRRALEP